MASERVGEQISNEPAGSTCSKAAGALGSHDRLSEATTEAIRLGCVCCFRDDFDGVFTLPDDWENIKEVQSYAESTREISEEDQFDWETHLGVCPECVVQRPLNEADCPLGNWAWKLRNWLVLLVKGLKTENAQGSSNRHPEGSPKAWP